MIEKRVRAIVGPDGYCRLKDDGCVEVAPRSEQECALVLAAAHADRCRVRVCGNCSWIKPDTPAALTVSTTSMSGITDLSPEDLVMTARVGTSLTDLTAAARDQGTWIALDPPGEKRTLGSVLATGTAGPLRTGYGNVRAQILGLTFITPDGRIIRAGGKVVKNVAGFDLSSLVIGSFGAFGIVTSAHIRLHASPISDVTMVAHQDRDLLIDAARTVLGSGITPAALELISQDTSSADSWHMAVRVMGSEASAASERARIAEAAPRLAFEELAGDSSARFWSSELESVIRPDVTIRMGSLQTELERVLDLLRNELRSECGSSAHVSLLPGITRWSCGASSGQIERLRKLAARNGWPVTLERAPWEVRSEMHHYGAYRGGVGSIVESLCRVFDDRGILNVPLGGAV